MVYDAKILKVGKNQIRTKIIFRIGIAWKSKTVNWPLSDHLVLKRDGMVKGLHHGGQCCQISRFCKIWPRFIRVLSSNIASRICFTLLLSLAIQNWHWSSLSFTAMIILTVQNSVYRYRVKNINGVAKYAIWDESGSEVLKKSWSGNGQFLIRIWPGPVMAIRSRIINRHLTLKKALFSRPDEIRRPWWSLDCLLSGPLSKIANPWSDSVSEN